MPRKRPADGPLEGGAKKVPLEALTKKESIAQTLCNSVEKSLKTHIDRKEKIQEIIPDLLAYLEAVATKAELPGPITVQQDETMSPSDYTGKKFGMPATWSATHLNNQIAVVFEHMTSEEREQVRKYAFIIDPKVPVPASEGPSKGRDLVAFFIKADCLFKNYEYEKGNDRYLQLLFPSIDDTGASFIDNCVN